MIDEDLIYYLDLTVQTSEGGRENKSADKHKGVSCLCHTVNSTKKLRKYSSSIQKLSSDSAKESLT